MSEDGLKREAAHAAVKRYVRSGMVVGLGTGSTATFAVRRIGELVASGELRDIRGVPTSAKTTALANELGITLATLSEARPRFTIDGADEISPELALIKGRGGALLREKIVAASSEEGLIVIADPSKLVDALGEGPLPVEIDSFGWENTLEALASLEVEIKRIPGALECGLFVGLARAAVVAGKKKGTVFIEAKPQ